MSKTFVILIVIFGLSMLGLTMVVLGFNNLPSRNGSAVDQTETVQTMAAAQTQAGINTIIAELTEAVKTGLTPVVFTATPQPANSQTATTIPSTTTPVPPPPKPTSVPCNWIQFISDVTYPDNSILRPNASFTKTWRLKNIGSCTWNPNYAVVFVSGNSMNGPAAVKIGDYVNPGGTIDVSVNLTAPGNEGTYTGNWMLRNDYGQNFGIGANASSPFWVKIKVEDFEDVSDEDLRNFAISYTYADWRSTTGSLPVPGSGDDFNNGSITQTDEPAFENGYTDDEPTLITIPSDGSNGMITGHYPAIRINSGDRFRSIIGCSYGFDGCDATFQLNYNLKDSSAIYNLGSWHEKYDGMVREIVVDLNSLAGKDVEFHLIVNNNGDSHEDRVFWLMPGID